MDEELKSTYITVAIASISLCIYMGCEWGFGNYVSTYSVKQLGFQEQQAALVASVYWGAFLCGRVCGVFIAHCTPSHIMIIVDFSMGIVATVLLAVFSTSSTIIFVAAAIYGAGVSTIWPSVMMFIETTIGLKSQYLTILVVFASLGDAIIPVIMGLLFAISPMGFVYLILTCALASGALFIILIAYNLKCGTENQVVNSSVE
jgi:fucose permease